MGKPVNAPMAGKILEIFVKVGDRVKKNDVIVMMETMKMNVRMFAPEDGIVKTVNVSPMENVKVNTTLITLGKG